MRSKALIFAVLLLFVPSLAAAQEETRRNQVVTLVEGGFVAFKTEIAPAAPINTSAPINEMQKDFRTRAFVDENHVIHRVLLDAAGKYLFAYDLVIEAIPSSRKFNIAFAPLDSATEKQLLAGSSDRQPQHIATLRQSAVPRLLDDGDSIALDLLVNQKTGVKIVDLVIVSFDRANLWEDKPATLPRDFTLEAVALRVVNFRLLVDGNLVAAGKPGTDFSGALIWCYVEGQGRFIFSLVPREGYEFQKVGVVADNWIQFSLNGKHFEWLSSAPILPTGGTWNLWVLHDPTYLPFGALQVTRKEKSRLEKWVDSIKIAQAKIAKIGDPMPAGLRKTPADADSEASRSEASRASARRFRVMVGAADRMENLLPR